MDFSQELTAQMLPNGVGGAEGRVGGRWLRYARRIVLALVLTALTGVVVAWGVVRLGVADSTGRLRLSGLENNVTVVRDGLGVVDIRARSSVDAYRALGFIHGQERFFDMDLMRRSAGGELAALFGKELLAVDLERRPHRFREIASEVTANLDADMRARIDAYTQGVNEGLARLAVRPFPYLLLGIQPRPWTAEDSVLVIFAMFLELQDSHNERELAMGRMQQMLPAEYVNFLDATGTEWDAALDGSSLPARPVPGAAVIRIDQLNPAFFNQDAAVGGDFALGSNSWAVAGALTDTGAALVANDMHLNLTVPNLWFRACVGFPGAREPVRLCGLTLPGVPALIAGSNGHIAWGLTNSMGDWMDWVRIRWSDAGKSVYLTPEGSEKVRHFPQTIQVRGGPPTVLDVRETRWGPIIHDDARQGTLVLAWTAHFAKSVNFAISRLETVSTVSEALDVAPLVGVPALNFVVGDAAGHIGWTIMGAIPARAPDSGKVPSDWTSPGAGWSGWLAPADYPRIEDPPGGRIWSANARMVGGEGLQRVGDGDYVLGARAGQIRDDLNAKSRFTPRDMLGIQLDDRALFLARWWQLLRTVLKETNEPALAPLDDNCRQLPERADPDSVCYRLVREFRLAVHQAVIDALAAPMRAHDAQFRLPLMHQLEGGIWTLLSQRPRHFLPPPYQTWNELLAHAARDVARNLLAEPGGPQYHTWGRANIVDIRHPLSDSVPWLASLLDVSARQLPGDGAMPRVQAPSYGASERFAVSPGHEADGYLHMPGGQVDNPLSSYYKSGTEDWAQGRYSPFLPGKSVAELTLVP